MHILEDGLKRLKRNFDFILFDLRPAIDLTVENALLISSTVVVPVDMDNRALKGIDDLLEVIREVKRNTPFVYTTVITKVDKRNTVMQSKIRQSLKDKNYPVAQSEIRVSEQYKHATASGRPSIHYASNKVKEDYMALTKEILG
ncbi:ParA family protein [Vibrio sp. 10N.261.46.A3]|uniref:ParA family protein n=1 Tax=Vibrio sp. 10N.261.46.A3 TaxID=3229658 RepID=UPI0035517D6F